MSWLITCKYCDVVQQSPESKRNHGESDLIEAWFEYKGWIICSNCHRVMGSIYETECR